MLFCKIKNLKIQFFKKKALFSKTKNDRDKRFSASERASKSTYQNNKKCSYKNLEFLDKKAIFHPKIQVYDTVIDLHILTQS